MNLTAWRIVKARHVLRAFDGEGARRLGGRWNSRGTPMVYAAGSQSLAVLEMLVHLDHAALMASYCLISITFPRAIMTTLEVSQWPADWNQRPTPLAVREVGDAWIAGAASAVLQVPSVVVPRESNFLFNPGHADFHKEVIGKAQPFVFDPRLKKD